MKLTDKESLFILDIINDYLDRHDYLLLFDGKPSKKFGKSAIEFYEDKKVLEIIKEKLKGE